MVGNDGRARPERAGRDTGTWFGVLAPVATPKPIVARLNEMVKVIQSPDFRKRMAHIGAEPIGNSADQMAAHIRDETKKFGRLVREAKLTIEQIEPCRRQ